MKKYIFSLFCVFIFAVSVNAAVPNEIRYNGRLKSYQTPVNGTVNMIFNLYYQSSGGSSVWTSGPVSISVSSGVFTYDLKPTDIDWRKGGVWLGLTVDGVELLPREKLMSQPYSFHALKAENGVPPGTVIAFAGSEENLPDGYLLCNGQDVLIDDYQDLFAAIGSLYGTASGGKFKLPNFQGMFLRGAGSNTVTTTPGGTVTITAAALGTKQSDAARNITGRISAPGSASALGYIVDGAFEATASQSAQMSGTGNWGQQQTSFNASRVVPTANENRPVNYSVNYCIKY